MSSKLLIAKSLNINQLSGSTVLFLFLFARGGGKGSGEEREERMGGRREGVTKYGKFSHFDQIVIKYLDQIPR